MSTAVLSHPKLGTSHSRQTAANPSFLSNLLPAVLLSSDLVGLTAGSILASCLMGRASSITLLPSVVIVIALFSASGLYRVPVLDPVTEIRKLSQCLCLAASSLACLTGVFIDVGAIGPRLFWLLSSMTLVAFFRSLLRAFLIRFQDGLTPAVLVGADADVNRLYGLLAKQKHLGFRPVAILDACLPQAICDQSLTALTDFGPLRGLSLQTAQPAGDDHKTRVTKRIIDLVLALIAAIVSSPFWVVIYLAIRFTSNGPVLHRQTRIGKHGRRFETWKFRSMAVNAEEVLNDHLATNAEAKAEWELTQKLKNDPRVFPVGRWLRKWSADELPQLWNVMRGEMSLVGPRPIQPAEISRYGDAFELYESVLPGMTGLWQVSGRSNTSYEERVSLDEYYVKNCSVWLDFHILFRTVRTLLLCEGAC